MNKVQRVEACAVVRPYAKLKNEGFAISIETIKNNNKFIRVNHNNRSSQSGKAHIVAVYIHEQTHVYNIMRDSITPINKSLNEK